MHTLFPEIEPYDSGFLQVDEIHQLYYEQSGNPKGYPVLFLHGGPGAGASPQSRRFFDPSFYRIVIMDQRGSGRSKPHADMRHNTTPLLVDDIEKIRTLLKITQWVVFGGSWGSTLALTYAQAHPEYCRALILRGIFLCRESEINWFFNLTKHIFPEVWEEFVKDIPEEERDNLLDAYYTRVMHGDPAIHEPAARAYNQYETMLSKHQPSIEEGVESFNNLHQALSLSRAETHYFKHAIFQQPNQLLNQIQRIRHIQTHVIHGRYDIVCPIVSAFDLFKAWPEIEAFKIIPNGGHSAFDPAIRSALIESTEHFKMVLGREL